jgi:DNA-directed RNA polymerase subunit RPC12/RpoP
MTVKVIGHDSKFVKETSCKNCASRLQYTNKDVVKLDCGKDISGCASGYAYIKCPTCNSQVVLETW